MNIAFFDFDGTITTKDSLKDFITFAVGKPKYYLGLLRQSPMLAAYCCKLLPNDQAKEKLISYYFKGWKLKDFDEIATQYSVHQLKKIVRPKALDTILKHKKQGDVVVVVSASMENWLQAWCKEYDIALIATQLEVKQAKLTGKFASKNCYGDEKVRRIQQVYDLSQYDMIYAYGDSEGDRAMLNLAHHAYMRAFH